MSNQKLNLLSSGRLAQPDILKILSFPENTVSSAGKSNSSFNYLLDKLSHVTCSQWLILTILNIISFTFIVMAYSCTKH